MPLLAGTIIHSEAGSYRLGKWSPGVGNAINAIYWAWCGHRYVRCVEGDQALTVATCETGGTLSVWADNGQYENIFQMGSSERATYGWHSAGSSPWKAALAAHGYYSRTLREHGNGWLPWQCHEDGGLRW